MVHTRIDSSTASETYFDSTIRVDHDDDDDDEVMIPEETEQLNKPKKEQRRMKKCWKMLEWCDVCLSLFLNIHGCFKWLYKEFPYLVEVGRFLLVIVAAWLGTMTFYEVNGGPSFLLKQAEPENPPAAPSISPSTSPVLIRIPTMAPMTTPPTLLPSTVVPVLRTTPPPTASPSTTTSEFFEFIPVSAPNNVCTDAREIIFTLDSSNEPFSTVIPSLAGNNTLPGIDPCGEREVFASLWYRLKLPEFSVNSACEFNCFNELVVRVCPYTTQNEVGIQNEVKIQNLVGVGISFLGPDCGDGFTLLSNSNVLY